MKKLVIIIVLFFTNLFYCQEKYFIKIEFLETFNSNGLTASFNYEFFSNEKSSLYLGVENTDNFLIVGEQTIDFFSQKYYCNKNEMNNILVRNSVANNETIYIDDALINWVKTEEIKSIGSFICKKASCFFRGVEYVAWYTEQINVPFGPWKFRGLNGMILEVYDVEKNYHITTKTIEISEDANFKKQINKIFKKNKIKPNLTLSDYITMLKNEDKLINEQFSSKLGRDKFIEITTDHNAFKRERFF